jgi:hypothetical protein
MQSKRSISYFSLMVLLASVVIGCGGGGNPEPPAFTANVETVFSTNGIQHVDPNVQFNGIIEVPESDWPTDCELNPAGVNQFGGDTNSNGLFSESNVAMGISCSWSFFRNASANCSAQGFTNVLVTTPNQTVILPCASSLAIFNVAPSLINPTKPPSSLTITGQGMFSTYAMPQVYFYDENDKVWLQVAASSASGDGTSLVVPGGQVSFGDGTYGAVVYVEQANGTWNPVGGGSITLFTPSPPPRCKPPMPCC